MASLIKSPVVIAGLRIYDNSDPEHTLSDTNPTASIPNRVYPSHTTRVEVELIDALYDSQSPPGGRIVIAYRNPHVRPGCFRLWDEATGVYVHPMEGDDRLKDLKDYWDVYNPSEPVWRRDGTHNGIIPPGNPTPPAPGIFSHVCFKVEGAIASTDFTQFGSQRVYLKFDVETEDYDGGNPFQGGMLVALVGTNFEFERSFIVTDQENDDGIPRDIHGFLPLDVYRGARKYEYFATIGENFDGVRTYGIPVPTLTGTGQYPDFNILITPIWFDFQGRVTFTNFRLTNSKIFEEFQPAEQVANLWESSDRPGWMRAASGKYLLFSDDGIPGEVASANDMLMRGYEAATVGGKLTVRPHVQTYELDVSQSKLAISLVRNSVSGDRDLGTVTVEDKGNPGGTYSLEIMAGYGTPPANQLCTGYRLKRGSTKIADIRINGDGTIMIRNDISIATGDPEEELVDNDQVGLKVRYEPPSPISDFPVKLFTAGRGSMLALGDGAGVNIHAVHTPALYVYSGPMVETANMNTWTGVRSLNHPSVWAARDKQVSTQMSIEEEGFDIYPFLNQVVWINVLPPREYNPRVLQPPVVQDPYKDYQIFRIEDRLELFPTLDSLQRDPYPDNGPTAGLAQEIWDDYSDYITMNSDIGLWAAWQEAYEPRVLNSFKTGGPGQAAINQLTTFEDFVNECRNAGKRMLLYVSPFYFTAGMRHANNVRSMSQYFFQDIQQTPPVQERACCGQFRDGTYPEYTNAHKGLVEPLGVSDGSNLLEFEQAFNDLLVLLRDPPHACLDFTGFYMDGVIPGNISGSYYILRWMRQRYFDATADLQPVIINHVQRYWPFGHFFHQVLIPEAYVDFTWKVETFTDTLKALIYDGVEPDLGTDPSILSYAGRLSLDDLYRYVYSCRNRSNSMAQLAMYLPIGWDYQQSHYGFGTGDVLPRILERNIAYAEKYEMVMPFGDDYVPHPPDTVPVGDPTNWETHLSLRHWLVRRVDIPADELGNWVLPGTGVVTVAGNVVTIEPGTEIELPPFAAIQLHANGQTWRVVMGQSYSGPPVPPEVTIRPQGGVPVEPWTGFAFRPGDRYGNGGSGVLEILSPFRLEGMSRGFRFHQLTKYAKMLF